MCCNESRRVWEAFEVWLSIDQAEFMYLPRICFFSTVRIFKCICPEFATSFLNTQQLLLREKPKYSLDFYAHLRLCRMSPQPGWANRTTNLLPPRVKYEWTEREIHNISRIIHNTIHLRDYSLQNSNSKCLFLGEPSIFFPANVGILSQPAWPPPQKLGCKKKYFVFEAILSI